MKKIFLLAFIFTAIHAVVLTSISIPVIIAKGHDDLENAAGITIPLLLLYVIALFIFFFWAFLVNRKNIAWKAMFLSLIIFAALFFLLVGLNILFD